MSEVTIFHNPACSTSRKVLELIREAGVEPEIVLYLKAPPSRAELLALLAKMGVGPRAILRKKGTPYEELGLGDPGKTDAELIEAILAHPILIERPIVVTPKGARICRPIETVTALLS
jgi:arsenate reductase